MHHRESLSASVTKYSKEHFVGFGFLFQRFWVGFKETETCCRLEPVRNQGQTCNLVSQSSYLGGWVD